MAQKTVYDKQGKYVAGKRPLVTPTQTNAVITKVKDTVKKIVK